MTVDAAFPTHLHPCPRGLPAADADLHQVGRGRVLDVGGVEPRRGVHPLVEVGLLGVDVPVEVDDADVAVHIRRHAADGGEADRVVPAEHHGHHALLHDVRHRLADLVERLLQVAGDGEHVTDVDHVQLFAQVDTHLVVVGAEEVRGAADALRTEPGARPVGGTRVERHAEERHLGVVDLVDVLDERTVQERPAFAREVRQLPATNVEMAVVDRRRRLSPKARPRSISSRSAVGQLRLGLLGPRALAVERFRWSAWWTPRAPSCRRPGTTHLVRGAGAAPDLDLGSDRRTRHLMQRGVNTARHRRNGRGLSD